jgi:hypothetical protein
MAMAKTIGYCDTATISGRKKFFSIGPSVNVRNLVVLFVADQLS